MSRFPQAPPRLVALDMDDTLLEEDLTLSQPCVKRIRAAVDAGIRVVLATGRMFRSALPFAERLGLDGWVIAYNGGMVRAMGGGDLWHRPVPVDDARAMIGVARREGLRLNLFVDDTLYVEAIDERVRYYTRVAGVEAHPVGDLERALALGPPTKCLFVGDPDQVAEAAPRLQEEFPGLRFTRSKPRYIEVTRRDVHKQAGLAAVAQAYGVPREAVMAVGDADNDATMLAWAGWGVAVANASPEAREAADVVVTQPRGRGVCEAFERFVAPTFPKHG